MKATVESTRQIVEIQVGGGPIVRGRLWTGTTEGGVPVQMVVLRVAAPIDADQQQFKRELDETPAPVPAVVAFPLRMLL